jgi:hypothetical protein
MKLSHQLHSSEVLPLAPLSWATPVERPSIPTTSCQHPTSQALLETTGDTDIPLQLGSLYTRGCCGHQHCFPGGPAQTVDLMGGIRKRGIDEISVFVRV